MKLNMAMSAIKRGAQSMQHQDGVRHTLDGAAYIGVLGSLADILPPVAAGLSIVWLLLQIATWCINKRWRPEK